MRTAPLFLSGSFRLRPARTYALLSSLALAALALHRPAHAQAIDMSHGGQITVTAAGGFDWDQNQKKVTAYDQAKAVRGDVTVTADKLIAFYRKKAPADGAPAPTGGTAPHPPAPAGADKKTAPQPDSEQDSGANEIYRLEAIGHVHIYTNTDQAWGDHAVYDIDQATMVMTGKNMKLTTPQDVMTARDSMEYYAQQHISIGRGNATVTTNDQRQIRADVLVGYSAPAAPADDKTDKTATDASSPLENGSGKLEKVNAFGHVWVRTQTETVTGDRGVYVPDTGIARIVGNVHITRGPNQIQGAAAIINMHTGLATMSEQPGGRVSGVVVPANADTSDRK
ncbi:LptA/OstA family protein [Acetobacter peroxydans]|jgi:lipopolysaccharide export system protein LptA|uniref:LptA/OstA family protein n=1 Tax=Acetobacter peroxydans TaxID=104098 RepID=UPI002354DD83|nr:LptA/OstA family protein [Acetobacter peroxydans]MCH4143603.1 LptA/OstA family protein [Acetobacter peroxydans]MCI1395303.1 LptA/OstA family protein [Acetobacter peroxydans]MCI1410495.1 LptA/OstA family protein [Acetobacter peroxydans]MCI1439240.1 LptA/OstA family protein [Acetobacter peroxydans]MCI1565604.1 LptA/OstA family protein [Acetobacter peroxydans]